MNVSEEVKTLVKESVDVEALINHLGFKIYRSTSNELRAPCIIHGGDNPTAFSVRLSSRKWKCFTSKCEMSPDGRTDNDLISLVMKVCGLPFIDALQYLSDFSGLGIDVRLANQEVSPEYYQKRDIDRFVKRTSRLARPVRPASRLQEDTILDYKRNRDDYFIKAGFQAPTLDQFEIGSTMGRNGVPSASIPIRDDLGNLAGLSLRRTDGDEEPKYDLVYQFEKDRTLYNLHAAKQTGKSFVVVVEGFKAAWAVYEAGYPNVVACMGSVITEGQIPLLATYFKFALLLFDGDEPGQEGAELSLPRMSKWLKTVPIVLDPDICPDDLNREELKELLDMYSILL